MEILFPNDLDTVNNPCHSIGRGEEHPIVYPDGSTAYSITCGRYGCTKVGRKKREISSEIRPEEGAAKSRAKRYQYPGGSAFSVKCGKYGCKMVGRKKREISSEEGAAKSDISEPYY